MASSATPKKTTARSTPASTKSPKPSGSAAPKPQRHVSTAKPPKAAVPPKKVTGTQTGRMSATKPAVSNVPKKGAKPGDHEQPVIPGTEAPEAAAPEEAKPEPAKAAPQKPEKKEAARKLGGLPITKASEQPDFVKMLVYGVPGSGKTYLAGTAAATPSMSPVLVLDIEGGTKTLRKSQPDVDVVRLKDTFDDDGKLTSSAWSQLQKVYEDLRSGKAPYKTIVIDTLTEAHALSMSLAIQWSVDKAEAKGRSRDAEAPEQADWGRAGGMVRKMVRAFRDLDCHVIFTSHEAEVKDDKTGAVTVQPSLPGKLAKEVPGYMDEVFYLYAREEIDKETKKRHIVRKVLTQPTGKYVCKDRSDNMPLVMADPTMEKIASFVLADPREEQE